MKSVLALSALAAVAAADTCESPVQRKNFTSLSNDEKLAWLDAEVCLTTHDAVFGLYDGATTLWDEQQYLHLTMSNYIHGVGQFLPWHRYYMTLHEKLLQTYCNYTGGMPYWDEQVDADNITLSAVWDSVYGIGGDGDSSNNQIVTDGPFANMEMHVGAWSFNTVIPKTATYHLNRSISVTTFQAASQSNVDECYALDSYNEAWQCYGQGPHSAGHAGTGGTMQDPVLSPGDPVFFLHHTNLDRLWWEWQSANLTARLTDMGGSNTPSDEFNSANNWDAPGANFTDYSGDPGNVTTLSHVLSLYEMLPNVTIADIMDIGGDVICAECQNALSFAEHEYSSLTLSDSARPSDYKKHGLKRSTPEEEQIISGEVLRDFRRYHDVHPEYENLKASANQGCQFCALLRARLVSSEIRPSLDRQLRNRSPLEVTFELSFLKQEQLKIDDDSRTAQWILRVKMIHHTHPGLGAEDASKVTDSMDVLYFPISHQGTGFPPKSKDFMPVLPPSVLDQQVISFIKSSVAKCVEACRHTVPDEFSSLPSRLIKVENDLIRLVEVAGISTGGQHVPFSTLSYCWGNVPQLKLGKDTLSRLQRGLDINELAAAHRDAIVLTKALSIPYIWIDALCIFQDDMEDWARESEKMRSIYASSDLTICATTSASSDQGFLDRTWPRVAVPFKTRMCDSETGIYGIQAFAYGASELDLHTLAAWDEQPHRQSLWSTRCWTFQEEIFSRRKLYFTSLGLVFSCSNLWYAEATRTKRSPKPSLFDQIPTILDPNDVYCLWENVISAYSKRGITKISDYLPALSGLARQFGRLFRDEYLAGLWRGDLLHSLLWGPLPPSILGLETLTTKLERQVQEGVPTWTWFNRGYARYYPDAEASRRRYCRAQCSIIEASTTPKHGDAFGQLLTSRLVLEAPIFWLDTSSTIMPDSHFWTAVTMGSTRVNISPDWLPGAGGALPSELLLLIISSKRHSQDGEGWVRGLIVHPMGQQGVYYRIGRFKIEFDESSLDPHTFMKDYDDRKSIIELA